MVAFVDIFLPLLLEFPHHILRREVEVNLGCGQPIVPVDADGDGVVDSIQVNAKTMGFSPSQIAEISSAVNPSTKKNGKVFVALRIVPHGVRNQANGKNRPVALDVDALTPPGLELVEPLDRHRIPQRSGREDPYIFPDQLVDPVAVHPGIRRVRE